MADAGAAPCEEGDEFDGSRAFRAVWNDRWEAGEPYPPLSPPVAPGRWNDNQQPTVYTSHEPGVAMREKLEHLEPETWAGGLLSARGRPARSSIVVVGFGPLVVQTYDGRAERDPERLLGPLLGDDHRPAQAFAAARRALGDASLIVPSAPLYRDRGDVRWNQVFYVGRAGQPMASELPKPSEMSVECEAGLATILSAG